MKHILFSLILASSLSASVPSCATLEQTFLTSADTFTETGSCKSQAASINAFKQLLLNHCSIDTSYVTIVYYLHQHPCVNEVLLNDCCYATYVLRTNANVRLRYTC